MTSYSLHHIAELLHAELVGDPACQITHMAPIESATAGAITFLLNAKYQRFVATTKASCLIVPSDFDGHFEGYLIKMSNPNLGYAKLASLFVTKPIRKSGIHATAVVGDNCEIADSVTIGGHVVLGDRVVIKDHALIGPGSVIGDDCYIGAETELAANVTLYHGIVV
ncbi:MAG: UDP-3-O-(3-hydroxymyristoyl)glucosamine N-acyltransferase, partial [Coxiellaceae bacterium]|nr:UDP-3-O-(3-hydroxymyristoyl)glucosamine N-acyltransferase [Coxiellaceae bacterium]